MRTRILIAASVAALSSAPAIAQEEIREPQIPPSLEGSIATQDGVYTSSEIAGGPEEGDAGWAEEEPDEMPVRRVYIGSDPGVVIADPETRPEVGDGNDGVRRRLHDRPAGVR